ncbi:MAG TPA: hypothetical protein VGJ18_22420 [Gemmatimonadaceae bacterium]
MARGSLQEVATLMIIAERRMYLTVEGALGHQGAGGSRLAIVEWLATLAPEATMTTNYQPPTTSHQPPATSHQPLASRFLLEHLHRDGDQSLQLLIRSLGQQRLCPHVILRGRITIEQPPNEREKGHSLQL